MPAPRPGWTASARSRRWPRLQENDATALSLTRVLVSCAEGGHDTAHHPNCHCEAQPKQSRPRLPRRGLLATTAALRPGHLCGVTRSIATGGLGVAAPRTRMQALWLIGALRSAPPTPPATGRDAVEAPPPPIPPPSRG